MAPAPGQPTHAELAGAFDRAADVYARSRPTYPDAALDWLLPAGATRVLDLGAGTGKLTARLAERELDIVAVEPSKRMLDQLTDELGDQVTALTGSAEGIPLPDGGLDVVLVAQAWHWVDPDRAVPEVARVLRRGGRLGLLWNVRDERVAWMTALAEIMTAAEEAVRAEQRVGQDEPGLRAPFGATERFTTPPWTSPTTPEGLVELVASRSYVITLAPDAREALLDDVRALIVTHPDLAGRGQIDVPYVTRCVRAERG